MTNNQDIKADVRRIIAHRLDIDDARVTPTARLIDDLGADSLGLVELLLALEEAFDIDLSDDEAERIWTVRHVLAHIEKAVATRSR